MRLSDAGLRRLKTKAVDPDHRSPPWPNEDAPRDRSNRLLERYHFTSMWVLSIRILPGLTTNQAQDDHGYVTDVRNKTGNRPPSTYAYIVQSFHRYGCS
jgi:hypothetical protein